MSNTTTYKQTEVGLIPSDWEVKKLGDVSFIKRGKFTPRPRNNPIYYGGNIPFVQTGDVTKSNGKIIHYTQTLNEQGLAVSALFKKGTILMTIAANIGYTGILQIDMACPDSLVAIDGINTDNNFLNFYFSFKREKLEELATTGAQMNLNIERLTPFQIPLPPTKAEQTAIATALSDADALISSLEKLIAKKRNIKQGAMQQLFETGNLQELRLDDIVVIKKGEQLNKSDMSEKGTYPALNGGIEPSGYTDKWNTEKDTITISEGGNSCGFVNFSTERFWLGGHCYAVELIDAKFPKVYLYQYLKYSQKQIMELRVGSGLPNIQKTALNNFKIKIHKSHDEKIKVANCLNDMDAEINALETKLEKYKKVKLGMMQNLLTGKIRLV